MNPHQTVSEMVEEILSRQARKLVDRSGMSFADAMTAVAATEAGVRLKALGEGDHRHEKARFWQANLLLERARRRADELGWRWGPKKPSPSPPLDHAPLRGSQPERASVREGA